MIGKLKGIHTPKEHMHCCYHVTVLALKNVYHTIPWTQDVWQALSKNAELLLPLLRKWHKLLQKEKKESRQILKVSADTNNTILIRNDILQIVGNGFTDCPDGLVNNRLETEHKL